MRYALLTLLVLALLCSPVSAFQLVSVDSYTLDAGAATTNELIISANTVRIAGAAHDDLFIMATTAELGGRFDADVWAMADAVTFTGEADDDVRVFGRALEVRGNVRGSLTAIANSIVVSNGVVIRGTAVLIGETVISEGDVHGSLKIAGSSATISGHVHGNVRVAAEDIVIMPGTEIDGDLIYSSSEDIFLDKSVKLNGQLVRKTVDAFSWSSPAPTFTQVATVQSFFYVCAMLAALPFMALFPRFTGLAVRQLRQRSWASLATGVVAICIVPLASLLLMITVIGIPLAILLLSAYGMLIYLAKVPVALMLGGLILRRRGPQPFARVFTALSMGLLILFAAGALPGIGTPVKLLTIFLGMGSMITAIFSSQLGHHQGPDAQPPPLAQNPATPPDLTSQNNNEGPQEGKE